MTEWLAEFLAHGGTLQGAAMENPMAILRYGRNAVLLSQLLQPYRSVDSVVTTVFMYGPTGLGKTVGALRFLERCIDDAPFFVYSPKSTGNWWDGYAGEEWVLIDELAPGNLPIGEALRILQSCRYSAPVHGGQVSLLATKFIITSNLPLPDLFPRADVSHLAALERRITHSLSHDFRDDIMASPPDARTGAVVNFLCERFGRPLPDASAAVPARPSARSPRRGSAAPPGVPVTPQRVDAARSPAHPR